MLPNGTPGTLIGAGAFGKVVYVSVSTSNMQICTDNLSVLTVHYAMPCRYTNVFMDGITKARQ